MPKSIKALLAQLDSLRERQEQLAAEQKELLRQMEELVAQQEERKAHMPGLVLRPKAPK